MFDQYIFSRLMRRGLYILFALLTVFNSAHAVRTRSGYEQDQNGMWREVLENLQTLRHEVANHEEEIHIFEEKFKTQEEIIDALRLQLNEALAAIKEMLHSQSTALENKILQQENSAKGLSSNIKAFSNESTAALTDYKQRIAELEKTIVLQNRNIENMQSALRSLSEVLMEKGESAEVQLASAKTYLVKSGDSLEKIARHNNTTIKKLKEANALTGDQIIIGQKLQIPE